LAAGLAHELNNPAAAAVRSSARLREVLAERRRNVMAVRGETFPEQAREIMLNLTDGLAECTATPGEMGPLERSDRESDLAAWLETEDLPADLASALVDARLGVDELRPLAELIPAGTLTLLLRIFVADHEIICLTRELEEASHRISDLVKAVKAYSYMDQSPVEEVDVEQGIDVTMRMFQHQLKHGVQVSRQFAGDLPRIRANGSALNQVWTNLIDNALDAMNSLPPGEPRVLTVKTCAEPDGILVEIGDSGRSATAAPVFRRKCKAACSSPSSRPSRWAMGRGWDSTSCSALSAITRVPSGWSRGRGEQCFRSACRWWGRLQPAVGLKPGAS
jgi:signal transduction histidine kinase